LISFLAETTLFEALICGPANGAVFAQIPRAGHSAWNAASAASITRPPSSMKLDANQPVAEAASSHAHFDFSKLSARDRYKLLI
jgi:hypothetical protein